MDGHVNVKNYFEGVLHILYKRRIENCLRFHVLYWLGTARILV